MKKNIPLVLSILLVALGLPARADTLELKNGTVLQGKYLGGTAETVRFETSAGMQILEFSQVRNMTVSPAAPAAAPAAQLPSTVTLPGGTQLMVRMMDGVSSKSAPGATFTTKLEYDLVASGIVVAKAGTVIYGKVQSATQARRAAGRSTLDIRLTQMVPAGTPIPIMTSSYAQAGASSGAKVARAAAAGAIIGNNTGNGSSSDGAAIGAGVAMLKPGQTLTISPGTVLEFTLEQPVVVTLKN